MSFLRTQNIRRDEKGNIISGSASIMNTVYDNSRQHKSRQVVVEKLGKVLWLGDSNRSGIFLNPQRGLFFYDSNTDKFDPVSSDDPRLPHTVEVTPERHVVFGTIDMFLYFLKKLGYTTLLKEIFPTKQDFQRVICHLAHKFLKDGSHIHVDDFIEKTILSYYATNISTSTLGCDTRYFSMMGNEKIKIDFFKKLVAMQKAEHPGFGKSCLVDSTPLPNDIEDNPFNALSRHGTGKSEAQIRLVLVLDKETGIPVWYDLIPGNILDINTLEKIRNDVMEFLELEIVEYTLDAGYCSKTLIQEFFPAADEEDKEKSANETDEKDEHGDLIVRMPARKGYPFKQLYHSKKPLFGKGKYMFTNEKHTYFGIREEAVIFGRKVNVYVYVDKENALTGFRNYLIEHEEEYESLSLAEKDYKTVECGFFVLISTYVMEPKDLLIEYFARADIEGVFKTAKNYLDLLPLAKWTDTTVRGKILSDMIATPIYLQSRLQVNRARKSMTSAIGALEGSICLVNKDKNIRIDYPTKKVKELQDAIGLSTGNNLGLVEYFESMELVI